MKINTEYTKSQLMKLAYLDARNKGHFIFYQANESLEFMMNDNTMEQVFPYQVHSLYLAQRERDKLEIAS